MVSDESTCCDLLLRKRLSGSKEKLTSLLFNRENCTTLIHRFQSRYSISLMLLFWNVSILLRAFLRSDFQKRNRVWGNTCRKKVPLHPRGFPLQKLSEHPREALTVDQDEGYFQVLPISCRTTCSHYCLPKRLAR